MTLLILLWISIINIKKSYFSTEICCGKEKHKQEKKKKERKKKIKKDRKKERETKRKERKKDYSETKIHDCTSIIATPLVIRNRQSAPSNSAPNNDLEYLKHPQVSDQYPGCVANNPGINQADRAKTTCQAENV